MAKKNIIFADNFETREEIEGEIRSNPEEFGFEPDQMGDDCVVAQAVSDRIEGYFWDEKANLHIELPHDVVIIAMQQCWDGTSPRVSRIGRNLNVVVDCPFRDIDEQEVYADRYNVCWRGTHHDGTNTAVYRVMKDDDKYDAFLQALITASEKTDAVKKEAAWKRAISRYTKSLRPEVAAVYGW